MNSDEMLAGSLTRAQVLKRAAAAGLGVSSLSVLAACGSDGSSATTSGGGGGLPPAKDITGTITLLNYPGWMGPQTVPGFEEKYPGAHIKQTAAGYESLSGVAESVAANPTAYDAMLATIDNCEQLEAGGFVLPVDEESVPNLKNIDPRIRNLYRWGVASDTGTIGIGYRKDVVKEPIHTWADFWKLVPKYSNEVVMIDVDRDVFGPALIYLDKDGNSTDPTDLAEAKEAALELKPHVLAFKGTGIGQTLLDGSAVLTLGYNFETVAAASEDPNIAFIAPAEGTMSYIEGFIGISKTDNPDTVKGFLNYLGEPKVLAAHTNTTLGGPTSQAGAKYTEKQLVTPASDIPRNATMTRFLGADGVKLWSEVWSEFKAG